MKAFKFIVVLLMVIGALNWGLIGFFGYNFVGSVFPGIARFIYAIVGLAGLCGIRMLCRCCGCSKCGPDCGCHRK